MSLPPLTFYLTDTSQHFNNVLFHILLYLFWYNNITIQVEQWCKGKVSSSIYGLYSCTIARWRTKLSTEKYRVCDK